MKLRLELEPEEYRRLVELVYLGNWIVNGIKEERDEKYDRVEQKVYQLAPDAEMEGAFELDEESGQLFPSDAFEEGNVAEAIDAYDEYTLWQELADRLARIELGKRFPPEDFAKLAEEDRERLWDEAARPFLEEFETHGAARLKIGG
ncbi:MAG: hypothetical protein HY553_10195 [Elusimicrobia bacterium]|nr:hypothetical protein [Elusimicrobiota bacterium]